MDEEEEEGEEEYDYVSEVVDKKKDQNKDVLQHNKIRMKQTYQVPFEPHEDIYVDDAEFNLAKRRRRAGQRGGNAMCCHGFVHRHVTVGPYDTELLLNWSIGCFAWAERSRAGGASNVISFFFISASKWKNGIVLRVGVILLINELQNCVYSSIFCVHTTGEN